MTNITATQGDTIVLGTTITRKDKITGVVSPVDITSAKLWFTAKFNKRDTDADAVVQLGSSETDFEGIDKSITPADGGATITIPKGATEGLSSKTVWAFWDLEMEESDGTVTTVDSGRLALLSDVTKVS